MTDKELIRRALLGSREAQQECTEKGIVLPCPFCGGEAIIEYDSVAPFEYDVVCGDCGVVRGISEDKKVVLREWNTRPAPPVGKCGECKFCEGMSKNQALHCTLNGFGIEYGLIFITPESFCSYFEPKEE